MRTGLDMLMASMVNTTATGNANTANYDGICMINDDMMHAYAP